jgi:hypothetical protein
LPRPTGRGATFTSQWIRKSCDGVLGGGRPGDLIWYFRRLVGSSFVFQQELPPIVLAPDVIAPRQRLFVTFQALS